MNISRLVSVVAIVVCGSIATFGQNSMRSDERAEGKRPRWVVVSDIATGKLTDAVPMTTLFTPKEDGMYRYSTFAVVLDTAGKQGDWLFSIHSANDAGPWHGGGFIYVGPGGTSSASSGGVGTFLANAGTPVEYDITPVCYGCAAGVTPVGSTYEVHFTIERLEDGDNRQHEEE